MSDRIELPYHSTSTDAAHSVPPKGELGPLFVAAIAAFATYFCMHGFRKPFTAGTFANEQWLHLGLKSTLVVAQLLGYMAAKFIGIKVISEMPARNRGRAIIGLIVMAELALLGFAILPIPLKIIAMVLNGLPLGMVFGLVLAYLEGRRQTEALSAALCASFIMASGVVKSIGQWLIVSGGISEYWMPAIVGCLFFAPLFASTWLLSKTPPPTRQDIAMRAARREMTSAERRNFLVAFWPGLTLLIIVYSAVTIMRTARDDFAVEIWRDMGMAEMPSVFAISEFWVAILVTGFHAFMIWIPNNISALRLTITAMCLAFALVIIASIGQSAGWVSAMTFMVLCGIGLYVPYVAFHTTIFERLVAISDRPSNLGFLMYLADAIGYLGYSTVLIFRNTFPNPNVILPQYLGTLICGSTLSVIALFLAVAYFMRRIAPNSRQ